MINKLFSLYDVDVYVTAFLPEEVGFGQIAGQKLAVGRLVAEVLGPEAVLSHRPDGSPVVEGLDREISVSHCAGMAALAVGGCDRIGVDIELPRATLGRVVHKFLSASEMTEWVADDDLLLAWTIKEALYKAAGVAGVDFANEVVLPSKVDCPWRGNVMAPGKKEACYEVYSTLYDGACISLAVPCRRV